MDISDNGGHWPSTLKTFTLYPRKWEQECLHHPRLITVYTPSSIWTFFVSNRSLTFDFVSPCPEGLILHVAQHKLIGQSGSEGAIVGGNGDRTFWWTEQLNEVKMHTGQSLPVSCEFLFFFFFVFLFYFFYFRSVFPVLPGRGGREGRGGGDSLCLPQLHRGCVSKSNGMLSG